MRCIGSMSRKFIPAFAYNRLRALRGDFQYQERLGRLTPPWTAYGLLMAVRTAKKYHMPAISVAEFGVANGRGLRKMTNLAERLSKQSGVAISVFGFDSGGGLPASKDYRDHPEIFQEGDYPMQDFTRLQLELDGRAKLVIGDIGTIKSLAQVFDGAGPLAFASVDVDLYSSAKAVLKLIADLDFAFLLPTVVLHFDDVWSDWGYNRFAGELLAIEEMNKEYEFRKIDRDRYVDYWHGGFFPWHVSMHTLHVFDHSSLFKPSRTNRAVITR